MRHSGNMGSGSATGAGGKAAKGEQKDMAAKRPGPAGPTGPGPERKADLKGAMMEGASGGLRGAVDHLKKMG